MCGPFLLVQLWSDPEPQLPVYSVVLTQTKSVVDIKVQNTTFDITCDALKVRHVSITVVKSKTSSTSPE